MSFIHVILACSNKIAPVTGLSIAVHTIATVTANAEWELIICSIIPMPSFNFPRLSNHSRENPIVMNTSWSKNPATRGASSLVAKTEGEERGREAKVTRTRDLVVFVSTKIVFPIIYRNNIEFFFDDLTMDPVVYRELLSIWTKNWSKRNRAVEQWKVLNGSY